MHRAVEKSHLKIEKIFSLRLLWTLFSFLYFPGWINFMHCFCFTNCYYSYLDFNFQFITQILWNTVENAKRALILFVGPNGFLVTQILRTHYYLKIILLLPKHMRLLVTNNCVQQNSTRRDLYKNQRRSYMQITQKFFLFFSKLVWDVAVLHTIQNTFILMLSHEILLCYCLNLCRHSKSTNQTMLAGKKYAQFLVWWL